MVQRLLIKWEMKKKEEQSKSEKKSLGAQWCTSCFGMFLFLLPEVPVSLVTLNGHFKVLWKQHSGLYGGITRHTSPTGVVHLLRAQEGKDGSPLCLTDAQIGAQTGWGLPQGPVAPAPKAAAQTTHDPKVTPWSHTVWVTDITSQI